MYRSKLWFCESVISFLKVGESVDLVLNLIFDLISDLVDNLIFGLAFEI